MNKGRKKLQKLEYLENEKSWNKKELFVVFEVLSISEKIKNSRDKIQSFESVLLIFQVILIIVPKNNST